MNIEREQQQDRERGISLIRNAPVIWRTAEQGNQTLRIADSCRAEIGATANKDAIPDHLASGAAARLATLNHALGHLEQATGHLHLRQHRETIVETIRKLPVASWDADSPIIVGGPGELLPLLEGLTVPVETGNGLEVRLWDGCGSDTICVARVEGHTRALIHLAPSEIPADHIPLYQMLREGLWPQNITTRISEAI